MQTTSPAWSDYVRDPTWLPHAWEAKRDALVFAHLPRDVQRKATFIDRRFAANVEQSQPAPLAALPLDAIRDGAGPLHFVFHTSFCCSTLLARALDIPGVSMGLKEPAVLMAFARHWVGAGETPPALRALGVSLDLLSRPLAAGETQIVKPSNVANLLAREMMRLRPDAKALVLFSGIDTYLRALVRRGVYGRALGREFYYGFHRAMPLSVRFTPDEFMLQTDMQVGAHAWLMQNQHLASLEREFGAERVRFLNGDTLLANRAQTLSRVAAFFGFSLDARAADEIAAGPAFEENAKLPGAQFDAQAYGALQQQVNALHGDELSKAEAWAQALAQRSGAPILLSETLFD